MVLCGVGPLGRRMVRRTVHLNGLRLLPRRALILAKRLTLREAKAKLNRRPQDLGRNKRASTPCPLLTLSPNSPEEEYVEGGGRAGARRGRRGIIHESLRPVLLVADIHKHQPPNHAPPPHPLPRETCKCHIIPTVHPFTLPPGKLHVPQPLHLPLLIALFPANL